MTPFGSCLLLVVVTAVTALIAWLIVFIKNRWLHYRANRWFAKASDRDLLASFISRDRMEIVAEMQGSAITALRLKFRVMPPAWSRERRVALPDSEFSRDCKLLLTTDSRDLSTQLKPHFDKLHCSLAQGWDSVERYFAAAPTFEYEETYGLHFRSRKEKTLRVLATRDDKGGLELTLTSHS